MRYTLGNLDQNLPGPASPSALDQLITTAGNNKFTAHDAQAGARTGPLPLGSIGFQHSYIIRQTQMGGGKGSIKQGFCDAKGNFTGTVGSDQESASITKDQANKLGIVYWMCEYLKPGSYTFQGGAG